MRARLGAHRFNRLGNVRVFIARDMCGARRGRSAKLPLHYATCRRSGLLAPITNALASRAAVAAALGRGTLGEFEALLFQSDDVADNRLR